jgi:hypothetical protein
LSSDGACGGRPVSGHVGGGALCVGDGDAPAESAGVDEWLHADDVSAAAKATVARIDGRLVMLPSISGNSYETRKGAPKDAFRR